MAKRMAVIRYGRVSTIQWYPDSKSETMNLKNVSDSIKIGDLYINGEFQSAPKKSQRIYKKKSAPKRPLLKALGAPASDPQYFNLNKGKAISYKDEGYPVFTYTGGYIFQKYMDKTWSLQLYTSGELSFTQLGSMPQIAITITGGGGAGSDIATGSKGTMKQQVYDASSFSLNYQYEAIVGAGATGRNIIDDTIVYNGETTSFFGLQATGGRSAAQESEYLSLNLGCVEGTGLGGQISDEYIYKGASGLVVIEGIMEET